MKKSKKRHMINVPEDEFQIIREYCHSNNLIISKWISYICSSYIKTTMSGSL